jgi:hypothetical protein
MNIHENSFAAQEARSIVIIIPTMKPPLLFSCFFILFKYDTQFFATLAYKVFLCFSPKLSKADNNENV